MTALLLCLIIGIAAFALAAGWLVFRETKKIFALKNIEKHQYDLREFGQAGTRIGRTTATLVSKPYSIYTTEFDVEISAESLATELYTHSEHFELQKANLKALIQNHESSKIVRMQVSKPPLVTLLIDHSGSMRGTTSKHLTVAIHHAAQLLERSSVPFEVMGFTTRSWNGGNARRKWLQAGKPPMPGRLCDLLYIIYKNANDTYESVSDFLAVMLNDNIRKENLDGEAVLWAHHRFKMSDRARWLCVMISDGAPVDDSTLAANPGAFLLEHYKEVIGKFSESKSVRLVGVSLRSKQVKTMAGTFEFPKSEELILGLQRTLIELLVESEGNSPRKN